MLLAFPSRVACRVLVGSLVLAGAAHWHISPGEQVFAQGIYDQLILPPPSAPPEMMQTTTALVPDPALGFDAVKEVPISLPFVEAQINADYLARAAVFGDNTRMADFAGGQFLPSAIPVAGQPFYGTDARANLQGDGSAIRVNAYTPPASEIVASAHAQLVIQNAQFSVGDSASANFAVRQVVGRLNRLTVGLMDTAFSDPSAVPETLDLAGPNARITAYDGGLGGGQGRLSYEFLSDEPDGLEIVTSVEQAIPEITPAVDDDDSFAKYPDMVLGGQYVEGDSICGDFVERWHVQWGTVYRDLSLESPNAATQSEFGWGTALSGAYRLPVTAGIESLDRVMFSVCYGEGISHYVTDLNAAEDTGDAVINAAGALESLPTLAWYTAYSHNWTDYLRSTATFSQVNLDSTTPLAATASPYRRGDYVAVNLVYHEPFETEEPSGIKRRQFFTGVEYLYGQKETLDGAEGSASRIMLVVAISN
jgi:hypothetical protein